MRHLIAVALLSALTACTTSQPEVDLTPLQPTVSPEEVRNDNHCRGLLMQPGTFVYVQCRLAMDGTQLKLERQARARLEAAGGPLPTDVENAMRADVVCNYNEASKQSQQFGEPVQLAQVALGKCQRSRTVLGQAVSVWQPGRFDALSAYDAAAIQQNVFVITQARNFPQSTPGLPPGAPAPITGAPGAGAPAAMAGGAPAGASYPPQASNAGVPIGPLAPMPTY